MLQFKTISIVLLSTSVPSEAEKKLKKIRCIRFTLLLHYGTKIAAVLLTHVVWLRISFV